MMQRVKNSEQCKDTATFYKFNEKEIYMKQFLETPFFSQNTPCVTNGQHMQIHQCYLDY